MAAVTQDPFEHPSDEATEQASGDARRTADGVRTEARAAADELKEQARDLASGATARARAVADRQKDAVAEQVQGFASALRCAAEDLNRREQRFGAGAFEQVAGGLEQVAEALHRRDLTEFVDSVEDFARRQPVAFIGASVAAGLALGRLVKSSARREA